MCKWIYLGMIGGTPIFGKLRIAPIRLELAVFLELIMFQTSRNHIPSYSKQNVQMKVIQRTLNQLTPSSNKFQTSSKNQIPPQKKCSRVFACNLTRKCRRSSIYCTHLFPQGFRHGFHPEMANIRHGGSFHGS